MKSIERFADLLCCKTVEDWCNQIFKLGRDFGYEQTRLAILPNPNAPVEAEHAFQHSNYSSEWLNKYTAEKMHHIDPTFAHCICKSDPSKSGLRRYFHPENRRKCMRKHVGMESDQVSPCPFMEREVS